MTIEYYEKNGTLCFKYWDNDSKEQKHGKIPTPVQEQGEQAIREYVQMTIQKRSRQRKRTLAKRRRWGENPNFPVSVDHDSKMLEGKITSVVGGVLTVRLEKPARYQGEACTNFSCFGAAMAGHYIWEKNGAFSHHAIRAAQELLISIYDKQKNYHQHKEVINLSKRLNERR